MFSKTVIFERTMEKYGMIIDFKPLNFHNELGSLKSQLSDAKLKEGTFDEPQIRKLLKNDVFVTKTLKKHRSVSKMLNNSWGAF